MSDEITKLPLLSWEEVCARRLERHGLLAPSADTRPSEIVSAMCGAHAQVMSAAELSIGLRIAGSTRATVREALWNDHSLIKSYGPRGTVHLLPAQDLPMWTGALSAIPPSPSPLPEEARLSPEQLEGVIEAMGIALAEAELTDDELTEALSDIAGPWAADPVVPAWYGMWPRWRPAVYIAANRGVLCFGPVRGRKVTYTSPKRWLPGFQPADEQTALADLLKRYLYAYGPATPQQFAKWLAAPRRWTADLFASLAAELQAVELDGNVAWVVAGDTAAPVPATDEVRLLPYFDAYTVGCHPRELLFLGRAAERALAGGQAGNFPVLLIGGTVAGVWHQRRSGKKITITVEPLQALTAAQQRAVNEQVQRIGEILEGNPQWTIGTITVGPHA